MVIRFIFLLWCACPFVFADEMEEAEQIAQDHYAACACENVAFCVGKVGRLTAVFSFEIGVFYGEEEGEIFGTYYYPARGEERTYDLRGGSEGPDLLVIREYTRRGGNPNDLVLSANIVLHKEEEDGKVVWRGTMYNTDGRELPMFFYKVHSELYQTQGGVMLEE